MFRTRRLPLAVATAILLGFWIADRSGSFSNFSLPGILAPLGEGIVSVVAAINRHAGWGEDLGSLSAITAGGVLLATVLLTPETRSTGSRVKFALLFIASTALAAMVVYKPWGIWKNSATPAWCLWAMSITAALWLLFYLVADASPLRPIAKPLAVAGQNVLLAYLISEALESYLRLAHLGNWYDRLAGPNLSNAIARSAGCAAVILIFTAIANRVGFRLKL